MDRIVTHNMKVFFMCLYFALSFDLKLIKNQSNNGRHWSVALAVSTKSIIKTLLNRASRIKKYKNIESLAWKGRKVV
jgi:hypothetical protein